MGNEILVQRSAGPIQTTTVSVFPPWLLNRFLKALCHHIFLRVRTPEPVAQEISIYLGIRLPMSTISPISHHTLLPQRRECETGDSVVYVVF